MSRNLLGFFVQFFCSYATSLEKHELDSCSARSPRSFFSTNVKSVFHSFIIQLFLPKCGTLHLSSLNYPSPFFFSRSLLPFGNVVGSCTLKLYIACRFSTHIVLLHSNHCWNHPAVLEQNRLLWRTLGVSLLRRSLWLLRAVLQMVSQPPVSSSPGENCWNLILNYQVWLWKLSSSNVKISDRLLISLYHNVIIAVNWIFKCSSLGASLTRPSDLTGILFWVLSLGSDGTWWAVGSASLRNMALLLQGRLKK